MPKEEKGSYYVLKYNIFIKYVPIQVAVGPFELKLGQVEAK